MTRRAVLLDRDGTLNERAAPHEYVTSAADFRWLPGAAHALVRLSDAGWTLGVASNQRGLARGLVAAEALTDIERFIDDELRPLGAAIGAFRYCPHDHADACGCRKPEPGLLLLLAGDLDIDLRESWMVGDAASDVAAGRAAGCRTALIGGSPAEAGAEAAAADADLTVDSLAEFAQLLVADEVRQR